MTEEQIAKQVYDEMCRMVGDIVLGMAAEGYETKKIAIADVVRTQAMMKDKWSRDQLRCLRLAIALLEEHPETQTDAVGKSGQAG